MTSWQRSSTNSRSSKFVVRVARRCVTGKRRCVMQASKSSMKQATSPNLSTADLRSMMSDLHACAAKQVISSPWGAPLLGSPKPVDESLAKDALRQIPSKFRTSPLNSAAFGHCSPFRRYRVVHFPPLKLLAKQLGRGSSD